MRKQFFIDLFTTIFSIALAQYFKEEKANEVGLALRFIIIFGCFCAYRIMAFLQDSKGIAISILEVIRDLLKVISNSSRNKDK